MRVAATGPPGVVPPADHMAVRSVVALVVALFVLFEI